MSDKKVKMELIANNSDKEIIVDDIKKRPNQLKALFKSAVKDGEEKNLESFREVLMLYAKEFLLSESEFVRFNAWKEMMRYTYPQRSATTTKFEGNIEINFNF